MTPLKLLSGETLIPYKEGNYLGNNACPEALRSNHQRLNLMPNDCNNSFTISPVTTDQWKELASTFQVRDENHQQGFTVPTSQNLDYSRGYSLITFPEIRANSAETEEEKERLLKNEPTIREDSWWIGGFRTGAPSGMFIPASTTGIPRDHQKSSVLPSALPGRP